MTMLELLPTLSELDRAEKLSVMHYLVTEMEKEEALLPAGIYPIWSPYASHEAAALLLQALSTEPLPLVQAEGR